VNKSKHAQKMILVCMVLGDAPSIGALDNVHVALGALYREHMVLGLGHSPGGCVSSPRFWKVHKHIEHACRC
jgi:hypothetical protein